MARVAKRAQKSAQPKQRAAARPKRMSILFSILHGSSSLPGVKRTTGCQRLSRWHPVVRFTPGKELLIPVGRCSWSGSATAAATHGRQVGRGDKPETVETLAVGLAGRGILLERVEQVPLVRNLRAIRRCDHAQGAGQRRGASRGRA